MMSVLSEEILVVSSLRSTLIPSQVRTLAGCYTNFFKLTIKPGLAKEFKTKVDSSRIFSKVLSIPSKLSSKNRQFSST